MMKMWHLPLLPLGSAMFLVFSQPVLADEFVNISDIEECRAIESKAERLLCYDTTADGGVFNEQKLQQVQEENFGITERPEEEVSVDQVTVTIVRVTKSSTGVHYFYTAQGAAWKQSSGRKWNTKAPFEAEIKSGVMGSFFLIADGGKSVRVKRVR